MRTLANPDATTIPTPDEFWVESVMNQFIAPTHPDQTIKPVAVTTPACGVQVVGSYDFVWAIPTLATTTPLGTITLKATACYPSQT